MSESETEHWHNSRERLHTEIRAVIGKRSREERSGDADADLIEDVRRAVTATETPEEEPLWQAQTLRGMLLAAGSDAIVRMRMRFTTEGEELTELTGRVTEVRMDYGSGEVFLICDYDLSQHWDNPPAEPAPSPVDPGHHH